jgi:hypothetical protein
MHNFKITIVVLALCLFSILVQAQYKLDQIEKDKNGGIRFFTINPVNKIAPTEDNIVKLLKETCLSLDSWHTKKRILLVFTLPTTDNSHDNSPTLLPFFQNYNLCSKHLFHLAQRIFPQAH